MELGERERTSAGEKSETPSIPFMAVLSLLRPTPPPRDESAQNVTIKGRARGERRTAVVYNTGKVLIWSMTALRSADTYSGTKLSCIRKHADVTPVQVSSQYVRRAPLRQGQDRIAFPSRCCANVPKYVVRHVPRDVAELVLSGLRNHRRARVVGRGERHSSDLPERSTRN